MLVLPITFFEAPPSTRLPNGSAIYRLEVPCDEELFVSTLDVREYFYHLRLPEILRPFFHLPALPARALRNRGGVQGVG